jgi:hypothetical protein
MGFGPGALSCMVVFGVVTWTLEFGPQAVTRIGSTSRLHRINFFISLPPDAKDRQLSFVAAMKRLARTRYGSYIELFRWEWVEFIIQ